LVTSLTEEDEADEEESELMSSGCPCTLCSNDIKLTDEVFLLRIVHPFVLDGALTYYDILDEKGRYKYPPVFFDFSCWEEEEEEIHTIQEDVPPLGSEDGIILCDICESDICQGEAMGVVQFGEIRLSERSPNNCLSASFVGMADSQHICIACIAHLEDNQRERIWEEEIEPIPNYEVCTEGLFERCWRGGLCACPKRICAS
jgi:hypothetical protein